MSDPKKITFDPTINLGHILTFVAMVISVMSAYSLLDKRIGVLEEKAVATVAQQADSRTEQKEALKEIKNDVKDLQRSVNEIGRALAGKRP
jgi:FtsZ-binding cell division protein ZapB